MVKAAGREAILCKIAEKQQLSFSWVRFLLFNIIIWGM